MIMSGYADEDKRYCERCGAELQEDEAYYLCKNCDLARADEEA
jgi:hypothetical protein